MEFNVIDEINKLKLGNIITTFEIDGIDKEFVLFSVEGLDDEDPMVNLCVAYIYEDKDGYNYIAAIDDKKIYKSALLVVNDMITKLKIKSTK